MPRFKGGGSSRGSLRPPLPLFEGRVPKPSIHGRVTAAAGFILLLALGACQPSNPGTVATTGPTPEYQSVARALEPFIRQQMADKAIPAISIALVDDQRVVWARGFGFANPADSTPATAETI